MCAQWWGGHGLSEGAHVPAVMVATFESEAKAGKRFDHRVGAYGEAEADTVLMHS